MTRCDIIPSDVDECAVGGEGVVCYSAATTLATGVTSCTNTYGGYMCECAAGYGHAASDAPG